MAFRLTRRALWSAGALLLLTGVPVHAAPTAFVDGFITARQSVGSFQRITVEDASGAQVTLTVNRRTRIGTIPPPPPDGGSSPTDLTRVGTFVGANYYRNSGVALSIGSEGEPSLARATGTLLGVNPLRLDQNGDGEADVTLDNAAWIARYFLGPYRVTEAELPLLVGLPVEVFSSLQAGSFLRLRAALPSTVTLNTRVESVEAEERRLEARLGSSVLNLYALSGADLTLRRRRAPLEVVRPGDLARMEITTLPSGARVLVKAEWLGLTLKQAVGTLTAVELPARRLTLATRRGSLVLGALGDETVTFVQNGVEFPGTVQEMEWLEGISTRVELDYVERRTERVAIAIRVILPSTPPPPPGN